MTNREYFDTLQNKDFAEYLIQEEADVLEVEYTYWSPSGNVYENYADAEQDCIAWLDQDRSEKNEQD